MRELMLINAGLIVLLALYYLTLRRGSFYQANRWSLMCGAALVVATPLLSFGESSLGLPVVMLPVFEQGVGTEVIASTSYSWITILGWLWMAGMVVFGLRILISFARVFTLVMKNKVQRKAGYRLVHVPEDVPVFSFFSWIFWNDPQMKSETAAQVLTHERAHVSQWHSADVMLMNVLCIVFWYNPAAWLLAREMKATHEYLADEAVLNQKVDRTDYAKLLIGEAFGGYGFAVASPFYHQTLLKQRIMKMTQHPSSPLARWKYILMLPLAALVIGTAACTKTEDKANVSANEPEIVAEADIVQAEYKGGQQAMMNYMMENLKYPDKNANPGQEKYIIAFTIDKDGKVINVTNADGANDIFAAEAVRVVSAMPDWNPATKEGQPVATEMKLPVKFVMEEAPENDQ